MNFDDVYLRKTITMKRNVYLVVLDARHSHDTKTFLVQGDDIIDRISRYINMEIVSGLPFDKFCERINNLPTEVPLSRCSKASYSKLIVDEYFDEYVELGDEDRIMYVDITNEGRRIDVQICCAVGEDGELHPLSATSFDANALVFPMKSFAFLDK